jgi:hypothetical protein
VTGGILIEKCHNSGIVSERFSRPGQNAWERAGTAKPLKRLETFRHWPSHRAEATVLMKKALRPGDFQNTLLDASALVSRLDNVGSAGYVEAISQFLASCHG